ncbi:MAG: M20/M25/M40 family metallo-hydrolase [Thermodesulfobacteriota bacterium]
MTLSSIPAPDEILQHLIRFDTTNPPGDEKPCIDYLRQLMEDAGFETQRVGKNENRPNLMARMRGENQQPPLLLYGHVDVVTAEKQNWRYPPFEGRRIDDYIWGRGALDMKGGVAMMVHALLKAKAEGVRPAGDIVFAAVCDEEAGGNFGARYLVEQHPELFSGIRYAIGEFGGASMYIGDKTFYPIQVTEKQMCWIKATVKGPGGHGSMPIRQSAMTRLGYFLYNLDRHRMPVRITPVVRQMIDRIADALFPPAGVLLRQLLNPRLTDLVMAVLGDRGKPFRPLMRNTVSPTIVRGGDKINVIPSEIELHLDGRLLPGATPQELIGQLKRTTDAPIDFEIVRHDSGPGEPDMGLFDLLATIMTESDPDGTPIPMLLPGVTDARFFSRIGIQTYGFTPMQLPKNFDFFSYIHNADERVPVNAVQFGARAIYRLIQRYGRHLSG